MTLTEQILSQLPGDVLGGLRKASSIWQSLKEDTAAIPMSVKESQQPLGEVDLDVVICGGTLGILIGAALAGMGWRVALIERGILRGREQEWNISRKELEVFLELNLLEESELLSAIATQYNPARISFLGDREHWVRDVLNIGVDPVFLLDALKSKFLKAGGKLFEKIPFQGAVVHPDGVAIDLGLGATRQDDEQSNNPKSLKTRLLIDAMGHFSPIVQQARQGKKPDAVCLVVGSCAQGFPKNDTGDLLVSFTPLKNQCQYFWEAFPARDGRTTYLFTYMDAHPQRPSLETLFEDYLRLLPQYQNVELAQLQFQRALFGFFPSYRQSPLKMPWSRILPVGDSSGAQSPLSFGGFGAMVRHLKRLANGINEALQCDRLAKNALALLQPYQPNLAVTWLFQRAMSVGVNQKIHPDQINQLLSAVFLEMEHLGDDVLKPFLQDVVQFSALSQTLLRTQISHPRLVVKVIPQVGLTTLLDWTIHYANLGAYAALYQLVQTMQPSGSQYYYRRWIDAWKYGSGGDYSH
ncbi:FAD-binding oxidoreductase [Argonema antarcticum]|uniref:FAD-binding oxidoreductase n=1 Tax=Argonema antarcticum TaxID=2942763 RepID=UPI0020120824|nr:FAD-binding oxidoreductase [Argonema antarcticum]MCL1470887.1 FAD-binding oxidoreductase [Argonema antarcticum A004/B2]